MQPLWSANTSVAHCDASAMDGGVHLITHVLDSRDQEIRVICWSAQRAYIAARILIQNGFDVRSVSGGMLSRVMYSRGIGDDNQILLYDRSNHIRTSSDQVGR